MALRAIFLGPYVTSFFIGLLLVAGYLFPTRDLIMEGGDAASIWQTIITFQREKITSSYVLYKGFLSVYPYVWFYELSILLKLDPFFFIKIYHSILFSFTAAIGIPYIVSKILNIQIKLYKNIIFVVVLFWLLIYTGIFNLLMVDLPSWSFFVAAIALLYLFDDLGLAGKILALFCTGIFFGLTLCNSGQYSLAGCILIACYFLSVFNWSKTFTARRCEKLFLALVLVLVGVAIPKGFDTHFEKTVVQPMRDRGEWLPTGSQWLISGLTSAITRYKPFSYPAESNRGTAILKDNEGKGFSGKLDLIKQGGGSYSMKKYLTLINAYPLDFFVMWMTKLFLALSFDDGRSSASHLFISYSALFICFWLVFQRCKRISNLVNINTFVILSIVTVIAAPVILHIEMRYGVVLLGFMVGFSIHQVDLINRGKNYVKTFIYNDPLARNRLYSLPIPYLMIFYLLFLVLSFSLYGALLEVSGSDPDKVLFNW